jgi:hypothetical protein
MAGFISPSDPRPPSTTSRTLVAALFRTLSRSLGEPAAAGSRVRHRLQLRLAGSAAAWLAALALTLLLAPYLQRANFAVFWVAVIFTAWYAGLGAALVSAVASVVAVNYFLIPPVHSVRVPGAADVLTLAIFTGAAATVSALAAGRADAKRSAEGYARQLEEAGRRAAAADRERPEPRRGAGGDGAAARGDAARRRGKSRPGRGGARAVAHGARQPARGHDGLRPRLALDVHQPRRRTAAARHGA